MISKANLGQQLTPPGGVDALTAQHPTAHSWVQVGLGTRGTGVSLCPPTPVFSSLENSKHYWLSQK